MFFCFFHEKMSKLFGLVLCDTIFIVFSIKFISFGTKYYTKDIFYIVFCKYLLIFYNCYINNEQNIKVNIFVTDKLF